MDPINRDASVAAVTQLLQLADQPHLGSQAGAAAAVLLAAFNTRDFPLRISILRALDDGAYRAALLVIELRARHGREPDGFINNGTAVFSKLADFWRPVLTNAG